MIGALISTMFGDAKNITKTTTSLLTTGALLPVMSLWGCDEGV